MAINSRYGDVSKQNAVDASKINQAANKQPANPLDKESQLYCLNVFHSDTALVPEEERKGIAGELAMIISLI